MEKKIELNVVNISNSQAQASAYAMVLKEARGERQIPIIIGSSEAQSIALQMRNIKTPRPLTHDLFSSCLGSFDILLKEVLIYKAKDGVFYSYIYFMREDNIIKLDARTSDAVALAIRQYCPIYIYESILEQECLSLDDNELVDMDNNTIDKEDVQSLRQALKKAIEEENYELASILRDEILKRE